MTVTPDKITKITAANHIKGPEQGAWTYTDYAALPDDGIRYEVVDGVLFMTPSPGKGHQDAAGEIYASLLIHVKHSGKGFVYIARFDVELDPHFIVQPDVLVILHAHQNRLTENRVIGAPDLVVEVTSPGTASYDRHEKLYAYAQAGVAEYWIVDPKAQTVELLMLQNAANGYESQGIFRGMQALPSQIVPDFSVPVEQFFR